MGYVYVKIFLGTPVHQGASLHERIMFTMTVIPHGVIIILNR